MAQLSGALGDKMIASVGPAVYADVRAARRLRVRRLMFSVAFLSPAVGLALMGFLTSSMFMCVAVMTISKSKTLFALICIMLLYSSEEEFLSKSSSSKNVFGQSFRSIIYFL